MDSTDLIVEHRDHVAYITINRPDKMNAFRGQTCDELINALHRAGYDRDIGAIVLAGAGDRAFCTGGDQSEHEGQYDGRGTIGLPIEELHAAIRDVPVPVIARVQGYAIGGGNVLATVTDTAANPEKLREAFRRAIPLGRLGEPDDLAGAVLFFASSDASFVTGQVLSVSGGLTMAG